MKAFVERFADVALENLPLESSHRPSFHPSTEIGGGNTGMVSIRPQDPQPKRFMGQSSSTSALPDNGAYQSPSPRSHTISIHSLPSYQSSKHSHEPSRVSQVVVEDGQMKVKTGGNQQPLGPHRRIIARTNLMRDPSMVPHSHTSESPLTDPTYVHPSRIEHLEEVRPRSPSEAGEILDSTTAKRVYPQSKPVEDGMMRSADDRKWPHDKFESDEESITVQKRSPSSCGEAATVKKPRLSRAEITMGDQANRLAAKELALKMRLRARHSFEGNSSRAENERVREISRQRATLFDQIGRVQGDHDVGIQKTDEGATSKRPSKSASPSQSPGKENLRIDRGDLPRASPLTNIGRLARIQEDIVQTKVQCALAGKEIKQEQKTYGAPSDVTSHKRQEKDTALQELINKRDVIKNDQQKLEAFNKGVIVPVVKTEEPNESPMDGVQDVPPFIKQEDFEPPTPQEMRQEPQRQPRSVRFNLNDVETLIDSVKRPH